MERLSIEDVSVVGFEVTDCSMHTQCGYFRRNVDERITTRDLVGWVSSTAVLEEISRVEFT